MAIIVIGYSTTTIDGFTVRIYDDSTEKYFEDPKDVNTTDYIEYLSSKGYSLEVSPIKIYTPKELNVEELVKTEALAKLTAAEIQALGL
jgi:hypothetical protein